MYRKYFDLGNSIRCALRLNDSNLALSIFNEANSLPISKTGITGTDVRRQLAFMFGKHQFITPYEEVLADEEGDISEMLGNSRLSEHFVSLGRELDIMDPKVMLTFSFGIFFVGFTVNICYFVCAQATYWNC